MSSDLSYHQKDNQKHETDNEQDSETISQISSNLIDMTLVSEILGSQCKNTFIVYVNVLKWIESANIIHTTGHFDRCNRESI